MLETVEGTEAPDNEESPVPTETVDSPDVPEAEADPENPVCPDRTVAATIAQFHVCRPATRRTSEPIGIIFIIISFSMSDYSSKQ